MELKISTQWQHSLLIGVPPDVTLPSSGCLGWLQEANQKLPCGACFFTCICSDQWHCTLAHRHQWIVLLVHCSILLGVLVVVPLRLVRVMQPRPVMCPTHAESAAVCAAWEAGSACRYWHCHQLAGGSVAPLPCLLGELQHSTPGTRCCSGGAVACSSGD